MLDDKGNTAVYLLYAYTRIRLVDFRVDRINSFTLAIITAQVIFCKKHSCLYYAQIKKGFINKDSANFLLSLFNNFINFQFSDGFLKIKGKFNVVNYYRLSIFSSICRTSGVSPDQIKEYIKQLPSGLPFQHEAEIKLAKTILKFSDCILTVLDSLMLHQVFFVSNFPIIFLEFV